MKFKGMVLSTNTSEVSKIGQGHNLKNEGDERMKTFLLLLLILASNPCVAEKNDKFNNFRIELCNFELPEIVPRASATFRLVYSFEIGDQGQPINVIVVDDWGGNILKLEQVASCVTNWRLAGLKTSKPVNMILQWKHSMGWTRFTLANEDVYYSIAIPPGFNRYYAQGKHWQHDEGGPVDQHIRDVEERTRAQFEE
jgi:hypothetical protein